MIYSKSQSVVSTFWIGTLIMMGSLICVFFTIAIDKYIEWKSGYSPQTSESKKISLKDLTKLGTKFWLVVGSMIGYYLSFLCFLNIATAFAIDRFKLSNETAGILAVILH